MSRLVLAGLIVGVVAIVGAWMKPAGVLVGGQESGTPVFEVATAAADPCSRAAAIPSGASPVSVATPTAMADFDVVYVDLVVAHTARMGTVAGVVGARAEDAALRAFALEMAIGLEDRGRRLGVWRSLWLGVQPPLTQEELIAAVERLGEASPGRGGIPGGFEALGMVGMADEACVAGTDDALFLELLIEAVDADLLLARAAIDLAEREELRFEAAAIAERDQQWLDGLIALRARLFGDGATSIASPMAGVGGRGDRAVSGARG